MKVGLLGGTFDPIHWGHLNLAFELMEKCQLDEVWFIPAQISPFKTAEPPNHIEDRLAMVQLAIQGIPQFRLKDLERERPPPSYTIDTLRAFISEEAFHQRGNQFYLLMGEDALQGFFQWHLPEEIVKLVPLLIGSRSGNKKYNLGNFSPSIRKAIEEGLIPTRLMDISGTDIRYRLRQHLYCGHLVPSLVLDYILRSGIYLT